MIKKIKGKIRGLVYFYLYIPIYFNIVYFRDLYKAEKQYGDFERLNRRDIKAYTLVYKGKARNICISMDAEIVKAICGLDFSPQLILLDGDSKTVVDQLKKRFNFHSAKVITAGIGNNFDFNWDFENDPPENLPQNFDLIVSQAMFEHLINPYKHLADLANRLRVGGVIIISTHLPGYTYHRYPIDAVRFFPDWFETSANRLKLSVSRKFQRYFNICYVLKKERWDFTLPRLFD